MYAFTVRDKWGNTHKHVADEVWFDGGAIVLSDEESNLVAAYGPGMWFRLTEEEEETDED